MDSAHQYIKTPVAIQVANCRSAVARRLKRRKSGFGSQSCKVHALQIAKTGIWLFDHESRRCQKRLTVASRNRDILPPVVVEIGNGWSIASHWQRSHRHA